MNAISFYEGMEQLSNFFGKKITDKQRDLYFEDLKYISDIAFDYAIKTIIRNRKPNPGQFPTITELKDMCPRPSPVQRHNPNETEEQYYHRVTVSHLWKALGVLESKGREAFLSFCNKYNFNQEDIERVENKHRMYKATPVIQEKAKELFNQIGQKPLNKGKILEENLKKLQQQKVDIYQEHQLED